MKRIITIDDIIDSYGKLKQRGFSFIISKFSINKIKRTKSAFNEEKINSSNWWIIPKVQQRWNKLITGDHKTNFEKFVVNSYLDQDQNLRMLSLGSGNCQHELEFATYTNFEEILCLDISDVLLKRAEEIARKKNLKNIKFKVQNIYNFEFPESHFDIVIFNASLHHFKNIDNLLGNLVRRTLKENGKLIVNEFVGSNRLQFPKHQIRAINSALKLIPKKYRRRYKLNIYKNKVYGSGLIRMLIADPSECIESENIIPTIKKYYDTIFEAPFGGNILMTSLKDISHHFVELNDEKLKVLSSLFKFEDEYLKTHSSDFIFGIYKNLRNNSSFKNNAF